MQTNKENFKRFVVVLILCVQYADIPWASGVEAQVANWLIDMIPVKRFFFSFQDIKTSLETLLLLNIGHILERGMSVYNFSLQDN